MSNTGTGWQKLREFAAVDLLESFVLSWQFSGKTLLIDLDLFLCPEHSFYEKPRPSQGGCFRAAEIEFPECTFLSETARGGDAADMIATSSGLGIGKISDLRCLRDGEYRISGKFGDVEIRAERPILRIKNTVG